MRVASIPAALMAALVGYGRIIALALTASKAARARRDQNASWIFAICLTKPLGSTRLNLFVRKPVVLARSDPDAVVPAETKGATLPQPVGFFVAASLLIAKTGAIKPLTRSPQSGLAEAA
jgi:benzoate membrane transport protein